MMQSWDLGKQFTMAIISVYVSGSVGSQAGSGAGSTKKETDLKVGRNKGKMKFSPMTGRISSDENPHLSFIKSQLLILTIG